MIECREDALVFSFPEVHPDARCTVAFQRTLRLPSEGAGHPLPPGLGRYRLEGGEACDDYVFPMYQSEALQVLFIGWYPFTLKVTADGRNLITGRSAGDERFWRPGEYTAFPSHHWMEWFCLGAREGRQIVARPLAGEGTHSGLSGISVSLHPMKGERYEEYRRQRNAASGACFYAQEERAGSPKLGGTLFGSETWDFTLHGGCTVSPLNTETYRRLTGLAPGWAPPGREDYASAGLPWRESYGADAAVLAASGAAVC